MSYQWFTVDKIVLSNAKQILKIYNTQLTTPIQS